jgi:muconate cycloisomerase
MRLRATPFTVHKRVALTISRGSQAENPVVGVQIDHNGIQGWGEACPFAIAEPPQTLEDILTAIRELIPVMAAFTPWDRQAIEAEWQRLGIPSAVRAAVDMALHDWMGKKVGQPLWRLWGLDPKRAPVTTVTIGILPPEQAQERAQQWIEQVQPHAFKVKMGNPDGIRADQAMLIALQEILPSGSLITVDANGGWTLEESLHMCNWLAGQGVACVEQPLERGREQELVTLWHQSPIPILADESCLTNSDIPALVGHVHGINIKLMKSGGLSEAMRMIHTARAHGMQVMLGCYGNTSLANTAAAHLGSLVDYLDLDSQLNLLDDPFIGALPVEGRLMPSDLPGLGVRRRPEQAAQESNNGSANGSSTDGAES